MVCRSELQPPRKAGVPRPAYFPDLSIKKGKAHRTPRHCTVLGLFCGGERRVVTTSLCILPARDRVFGSPFQLTTMQPVYCVSVGPHSRLHRELFIITYYNRASFLCPNRLTLMLASKNIPRSCLTIDQAILSPSPVPEVIPANTAPQAPPFSPRRTCHGLLC